MCVCVKSLTMGSGVPVGASLYRYIFLIYKRYAQHAELHVRREGMMV